MDCDMVFLCLCQGKVTQKTFYGQPLGRKVGSKNVRNFSRFDPPPPKKNRPNIFLGQIKLLLIFSVLGKSSIEKKKT